MRIEPSAREIFASLASKVAEPLANISLQSRVNALSLVYTPEDTIRCGIRLRREASLIREQVTSRPKKLAFWEGSVYCHVTRRDWAAERKGERNGARSA